MRFLASSALALAAIGASSGLDAQCSGTRVETSNWPTVSVGQADTTVSHAFRIDNPHPFPIEICSVDLFLGSSCGSDGTVVARLRERTGAGSEPGRILAESLPTTMRRVLSIVSPGFVNGARIEAQDSVWLEVDYQGAHRCNSANGGAIPSISRTGAVVEGWKQLQLFGSFVWQRFDHRASYRLHYRPRVRATFEEFGSSCAPSVPCGTRSFREFNPGQPLAGRIASSGIHAMRVQDPFGHPTRFLCSLETVMAGASASPIDVDVLVYDERRAAPGQLLGRTTIRVVPGPEQTYRAIFASPIRIGAGSNYWVGYAPSGRVTLPIARFGSIYGSALSTDGGMNWIGRPDESWILKTFVTTSVPRAPLLDGTPPRIGATASIRLSDAPAGARAFLLLGFSNPDLDLTGLGAAGCRQLCAGDAAFALTADGLGRANYALALPNSIDLLDARFFTQYAVASTSNPLGLVTTNGGLARIGSF